MTEYENFKQGAVAERFATALFVAEKQRVALPSGDICPVPGPKKLFDRGATDSGRPDH